MLRLTFLALLAACIGSWAAGAPLLLVFGIAIAAWAAFAVLIYPKIRTYKVAMGFDDKLNEFETTGLEWLRLKLAGFKVFALAFLTSVIPFLGDLAQWLNGQNLDFALDPSRPERKQIVTFVIGLVILVVPMLMTWLHSRTAANAATTEPKA